MAVGVIVGSSFTAIVNALSNNILKPVINYLLALIFGANSLSDVFTFLTKAYKLDDNGVVTTEIDLANSIYIDWGAFINAVINFFLVAVVLFTIVKLVNTLRDGHKKVLKEISEEIPTKADIKQMKKLGIKITDDNVKAFLEEKKRLEEQTAEREKAEAEEAARLERLANPTTEDLLKSILEEIRKS
jgi:large conductance mechanosensitive channel